ncbi:MAG: hypothetical protein OEZ06_28835 [Myxococcales bacterium]|nr:hypothetical protein [Myxococcales bacterium]
MRGRYVVLLAAILWASPLGAQARPEYDPSADRLQGLNRRDIGQLEPLLSSGPVALVEFADTDGDELPAVNLLTEVHASAEALLALAERPAGYPRFMGTLDEVEVHKSKGPATLYDWRWEMGVLTLEGENAMTVYKPPPSRASAGYRITIDSHSGDMGHGRSLIRILPRGDKRCLLAMSMRVDLRRANFVARSVARAARSINRSANMALTYGMVLGLKREAERRAGYRPPQSPQAPLAKPALDPRALLRFMMRGDLIWMQMSGDRVDQLTVYGVVQRPVDLVREVMLDANAFGSSLMPGSSAEVLSQKDGVTDFAWKIDLPLIGLSGRMSLTDKNPLVSIKATDGALEGGQWNFETLPLGQHATLLTGWARFDLRRSNWLLKSLLSADAHVGHGMTAASEVMLVRAVRSRVRKRALADAARKAATKR